MKSYDNSRRRGSPPARFSALPHSVLALCAVLAWLSAGCVHHSPAAYPEARAAAGPHTAPPAVPPGSSSAVRAEQIRRDCIQGRRLICGKVLAVLTNGLVVESGYSDLLRPALSGSWVIPGSVAVRRPGQALERKEPGALCIGTIFLTDTPKRPRVKTYDYVVIMGYPAGRFIYRPTPGIEKVLREFAGGLETATRLELRLRDSTPRPGAAQEVRRPG